MPLNNKKPVTYGKSHSRRLETYLDSHDNARLTPLASSDDRRSPKTTSYLKPSLPKSLSQSSASPNSEDHNTMQKKRRKYFNNQERMNQDRASYENHHLSSTRHPVENQGSSSNQDDSSNLLGEVNRVPDWHLSDPTQLSLNRQHLLKRKPLSQSKAPSSVKLECMGTRQTQSQRHVETGSTRKRLIDSLGTTGEQVTLKRANESEFHDPLDLEITGGNNDHDNSHQSKKAPSLLSTRKVEHIQGGTATQPSTMLRGTRVTYSRQRSFLGDGVRFPSVEHDNSCDVWIREGSVKPLTTNPLPLPAVVDDESNRNGSVRSIHELRQAGDNARFRETVDSIFEDIEDTNNTTPGRCGSFTQLCIKLLEPQFLRRFSEHGFDERLAGCMTSNLDVASISLALCAYVLVQTGGYSSYILSVSLWENVLCLSPLLDIEDDILTIAKQPSLSLARTTQASVRSVRPHILSAIKSFSPNLSPRRLALEGFRSSLLKFRDKNDTIEPMPMALLTQLIDLLVLKCPRNLKFPLSPDQFEVLELIFSILENYTIVSGPLNSDRRLCFQRLSQLNGLLKFDSNDQSQQILTLYIRVILNLTNSEPLLCNNFATDEFISGLIRVVTTKTHGIGQDSSLTESSALNTVILALGTLINLAEKTELSRSAFLRSNGEPTSFLQQLLDQFAGSISDIDQAHSVPEVHHNVVTGYVSILLLTLCLDVKAYSFVKSSLNRSGLTMVISTAEKFMQYHRKVERDSFNFEKGDKEGSGLISRMEHIISQIGQQEPVMR